MCALGTKCTIRGSRSRSISNLRHSRDRMRECRLDRTRECRLESRERWC